MIDESVVENQISKNLSSLKEQHTNTVTAIHNIIT